jgi:hypothetical protein
MNAITKVFAEFKDLLDQYISMFPFGVIATLFKSTESILELQITDDMIKEFKENMAEVFPSALDSFPTIIEKAKEGQPIMEIMPILEMIQEHIDGEINFYAYNSCGFKLTLRLPGLDTVINHIIEGNEKSDYFS